MADLINLVIVITFFWLLHSLIEAIRQRRIPKQQSVLERLQFDPSRHYLEVRLKDGRTITGLLHGKPGRVFEDGLLLASAQEYEQGEQTGSIVFIPAHNISVIAVQERTQP